MEVMNWSWEVTNVNPNLQNRVYIFWNKWPNEVEISTILEARPDREANQFSITYGCHLLLSMVSLSHVSCRWRLWIVIYCWRCAGLKWLAQKWLKTPKSAWVLTISIQVCCSDFNHILNLDFYLSSNGRAQSFQYIWYCGGVAAQWFSDLRL